MPACRPAWGWEPGTETQVAWHLEKVTACLESGWVGSEIHMRTAPPNPHSQAMQPQLHPESQENLMEKNHLE